MVRDGLAVPRCLHVPHIGLHAAAGLLASDHQQTGKIQFLLGVYRGTAPAAALGARARVVPDSLDQRTLHICSLAFLCQLVVFPVVWSSIVSTHCRVPEIADQKMYWTGLEAFRGITHQPLFGQALPRGPPAQRQLGGNPPGTPPHHMTSFARYLRSGLGTVTCPSEV